MVQLPRYANFEAVLPNPPMAINNFYRFFLEENPTQLLHIEELADTVTYHLGSTPANKDLWQVAMNKIRAHFNLEFKLRCEECGAAHHQDEISAPER